MSILVTGGAGFIGSGLVEDLLDRGEEVHVLDDFNDYYDPAAKRANIAALTDREGFHLHEGDIVDFALCERLFAEHGVRRVVHLAARAGVRPSVEDPRLYQRVNVGGTTNLLELARRHEIDRFVFASSSSVYGNNEKVPFAEDDRVDHPISPYAATKVAGELVAHSYHHLFGLSIACLRFFTAYGPRQRPEMAIHKFTRMILAGETLPLFGDGSSARDYTHIEDVVAGVTASLYLDDLGYEIINLGSHHPITLLELVERIEAACGVEAKREFLPDQPGDVTRTYADVSKAERVLGYAPKVTLDEGIPGFVAWHRERFGV